MTPEQLHRNFPDDIPLPNLLDQLCAFTEAEGGDGVSLGGYLELTENGPLALDAWFRGNERAISQFIIFATDETDGLYGYWRYNDQPLDRAPLVYLDDECAHNTVLASTLEEFLALVGAGQRFLGRVNEWDEHEEPDEDTLRYRDWLLTKLGVEPPTLDEGRQIIARARGQHPDLDEWIDQVRAVAR